MAAVLHIRNDVSLVKVEIAEVRETIFPLAYSAMDRIADIHLRFELTLSTNCYLYQSASLREYSLSSNRRLC